MTFVHPMAKLWNVANVVVDRIETPMPTSGGTMVVSIKAIEYVAKPAPVEEEKKVKTATNPLAGTVFNIPNILTPDADRAFPQ